VPQPASQSASQPLRVLHVVGGGCHNALLCQLTADVTGLPVIAGPAEATAAGNILVQALARGHVGSPADIRAVTARSTTLRKHEPRDTEAWAEPIARFDALLARATGGCGA
jgi:rhamnulokinase